MHYYQHNISDYKAATAHLTLAEDAVYRRLIDTYYLHEGALPNDVKRLSKLILAPRSCSTVRAILSEFFYLDGDVWRHKRIDAELEKYRLKSDKAKKSAEARWSKRECERNATEVQTQCDSDANHKPITNNHKPITKKREVRASRLTTDSLPDDWLDFAIGSGLTTDQAKDQFDRFHDYWVGVSGARGRKKDWLATWRNWIRRSKEFSNTNNTKQTEPVSFLAKYSEPTHLPDGSPNPNHWSNTA